MADVFLTTIGKGLAVVGIVRMALSQPMPKLGQTAQP